MKVVFDTNILIDFLQGVKKAKKELDLYENPAISIITWMEILVGAVDEEETQMLKNFLSRFYLHEVSRDIAEKAVGLRQQHKIKLPDAIIWATALNTHSILVTRNTKDFSKQEPTIRVPYLLH